jgi:acyl-ACP thioesterase
LYAIRAHNIYNAAGEMMAQSFTRWVTMQIETRGVGRIPAHLIERIYERELTALPYERLRLQKNFEVQRFNSYRIKASDVDQNDHTNNTVYMLKCIEAALSLGIDLKAMRAFSIQFKQETRLNSILEIQSAYNSRLCQLMIKDSDTSAEVSLAEIVFDR